MYKRHTDRQQNAQKEDQERSQSISYKASSYYYKKYPNNRILPFEVMYRAPFHGYIGECTQDRHHRQHTDQHFDRMDQSDNEENDDGRKQVISLVVQEVVDHSVAPFLHVLEIRYLEARGLQQEVVEAA